MTMSDPIADMLTRIRNANTAKHDTVDVPSSKMKLAIAQILLEEGYIKKYDIVEEGNFKTIRDILESYLAETLRYFLAGKHYRSPIDFSLDNMDESERSQKRVYECLREVDMALARENWKPGAAPAELVEELKQQDQSFMDALEDDVNTAAAMGHLFNMVRIAGRELEDKKLRNSEGGRDILKAFRDATAKWDTLLGLFAQKPEGFLASLREIRARRRGLDMNKVAGLLRERQEARAAKDFARSDAARDELAALGVEVRDTPEGPVWDII